MVAKSLCFLLLLALPAAGISEDDPRMNPVTKVVKLLEEMKAQVEKEAEEDKEMYEKMSCWCETNEQEKTKAVEIAEQRIDQATSTIEEGTAHSAKLTTEIEKLNEEIAATEEALAKAESMRTKEHDEFLVETGDMSDALKALKEAVDVLSKVQLMQKMSPEKAAEAFLQVKDTIHHLTHKFKDVMQKDLWGLLGAVDDVSETSIGPALSRASLVTTDQVMNEVFMGKRAGEIPALAQQDPKSPTREGGGGVAGAKSYNSRSGAIFGILTQMKDEFGKNLIAAQKEEMEALIAYHEMKSAKEAELKAARAALDAKTQDQADTEAKVAQAKQDLEDTQAAMTADQEFLVDLKEKCAISDKEYAARSKTRSDEIVAIGETIKILTDDDARDLFGKTVSLLQLRAAVAAESRCREQAAKAIVNVARMHRNWVLATLAVTVQLDAFTKVKKAMDDMIAELKVQQEEEVKKNDFCKAELDKNEDTIKEKGYLQEDQEAKIQDLEGTIETLTNDIDTLKATVAENHIQLKRAGEDRAAQNKEFQQVVADQRATVVILNKALARLEKFYAPKEGALAQIKAHQEPGTTVEAPPPSGKPYQKSGGAGGIMQMIQMIIEDAKRAEEEAVVDEQAAQTAYASFVTETNAVLEQAQKDIVNKSAAKAQAEGDHEETSESLKQTKADLEGLHQYNGELHADCDFVLKNFDTRQQARAQEIEAIQQAKAILSGAAGGGYE